MNVGIIAIAKNEDLYLGEWIDYHLKLGFDKIIIGLNDDEFNPPVHNPKVRYVDFHKVQGVQPLAYKRMYRAFKKDFDWFLFIDIDEFLVLENQTDVKEFLKDFDNDIIRVNERHMSDGEMLDVVDGNYKVFDRFLEEGKGDNTFVKSFINTRVDASKKRLLGHGIYDTNLDAVNVLGEKCKNENQHESPIILSKCWINHYRTKTIGEYIRQKLFRGGANKNPQRYTLDYFWKINKKTPEKVAYAQKIIEKLDKENDK